MVLPDDGYGGVVKGLDRRQMLAWLVGVGVALFGASKEVASQGKSSGKGKGNKGKGNNGKSGGKGNSGNAGNSSSSNAHTPNQSAAPNAADGVLDQDAALEAVRRGEALPLRAILPEIERRYRGDVIDAVLRKKDGKLVYAFKILSANGRVFVVAVDAATGRQELGFLQSFGF